MAKKVDGFNFDFETHWNTDNTEMYKSADILAEALMATGKYNKKEAEKLVSDFQKDSFRNGSDEEAFNNCGEDA